MKEFGKYAIHSTLGTGAQGSVYEATHGTLKRRVALKILHGTNDDEMTKRRFRRELSIAFSLTHPNLVKVYDGGITDDVAYQVMELLQGECLAATLFRDGPMSVTRALKIAADLADGLDCLHSHDVIHRDLKPANVMVTTDGITKLLDFGTCRNAQSSSLTSTGQLIGTPLYMAPELMTEAVATPACDIWSLGCIIYQLLARRMPFPNDSSTGWMSSLVRDPIPPIHEVVPAISMEVSDLIARIVERDPQKRLASAAVLRDELRRLMPSASVSNSVAERRRTSQRLLQVKSTPPGRRPSRAAFAVVTALSVLSGLLGRYSSVRRRPGPVQETMQLLEEKGTARTLRILREQHQADPHSAFKSLQLGWFLFAVDPSDESVSALEAAVRESPDSPEGLTALAFEMRRRGVLRPPPGGLISKAVELAPNVVDYRLIRANMNRANQRKLKEADADSAVACALAPNFPWGHQVRGCVLEALSRPEEAERELRLSLVLSPRYGWERYILAFLLQRRQRTAAAEVLLREAIAADPDDILSYAGLTNLLMEQERWRDAETIATAGLAHWPNSLHLKILQALVTRTLKDLTAADDMFRQCIALAPSNVPIREQRMTAILFPAKRFDEAEQECRAIIEREPLRAEGHVLLGQVLRNKNRFVEAEAELRQAISLDPFSRAHLLLLQTLDSAGRGDTAIREYRGLAGASPRNEVVCTSLARLMEFHHDLEGAAEIIRPALNEYPLSMELHQQLANILSTQRKFGDAQAQYLIVLNGAPSTLSPMGWFNAFSSIGKAPTGIAYLTQLAKDDPGQCAAHLALTHALLSLGRRPDAEAQLALALKTAHSSARYCADVGDLLFEFQRTNEAEEQFERALEESPNDGEIHYHYAGGLFRTRSYQKAMSHARRACELYPEQSWYSLQLASFLRQAGQTPASVQELDRAIALAPALPDLPLARADIEQNQGHLAKAIEILRSYLKVKGAVPGNPEVYKLLGKLLVRTQAWSEAETVFRRWLSEAPDPGVVRATAGREYYDADRRETAAVWLEPITNLPNPPVAARHLLVLVELNLHGVAAAARYQAIMEKLPKQSTSESAEMLDYAIDSNLFQKESPAPKDAK